jgi:hypothetical protein
VISATRRRHARIRTIFAVVLFLDVRAQSAERWLRARFREEYN